MDRLEEIKYNLQKHKEELKEKFHVREIGIFGSFVRGEYTSESDLDLLVDFYEIPGLFSFIRLKDYLTQITGEQVDLVMKRVLKPFIGQNILREVVYV